MVKSPRTISQIFQEEMKMQSSMDKSLLDAWDQRLNRVEDPVEPNTLVGGTKMVTHKKNTCYGYWCCIHNPSPHHMKSWEQYWNESKGIMYRLCDHGEAHPDPDDPLSYRVSKFHKDDCDGCCDPSMHIKRRGK